MAGERRRPAASSSSSDMTPPRASTTAPRLLLTSSGAHAAQPPPPHQTAVPRSAATSFRGARQSSSELSAATSDVASAHPHDDARFVPEQACVARSSTRSHRGTRHSAPDTCGGSDDRGAPGPARRCRRGSGLPPGRTRGHRSCAPTYPGRARRVERRVTDPARTYNGPSPRGRAVRSALRQCCLGIRTSGSRRTGSCPRRTRTGPTCSTADPSR
jgi:hypothetical protein